VIAPRTFRILCGVLIAFAVFAKLYDVTAPWKTHDHYNFGGVWTTTYAECLKMTPLSISKGIPHTDCWTDHLNYYRAHPPTILFAMWGWTSLFGNSEASYRLFIFLFSTLNIFMIFKIARLARPQSALFAWLAAVFQSGFLGGIYFGTHLDFIGEFTVFFVLVVAWLALKQRLRLAALMGLVAGISAWPGYIVFAPLWLYALALKKRRLFIPIVAVLGFALALATMMWLQQTTDIIAFLKLKLLTPGYISKKEKGPFEVFFFAASFLHSMARLLSPLFCSFAFFELARGQGRLFLTDWRKRWHGLGPFQYAVLLSGGTGLFYGLIGHEYFMVHVFLYLLLTPALALLCAGCVEHLLKTPLAKKDRIWLSVLGVLFLAFYPYGIFKSNAVHDALNSILFVVSVIGFIAVLWRRSKLTPALALLFVALGVVGNVSQTINYRNEPDTERSFCEKARAEFQATGRPVETHEERSSAKDFLYCRGIPIHYL